MAGDTQEDNFTGGAGGSEGEDDAMLLGFNTAMGNTSADDNPGSTATTTAPKDAANETDHAKHDAEQAERAAAEAEAAAAAAAEAQANAPVTLTRAQLEDIQAKFARLDTLENELATTRDKFNGRIGNVQQSMTQAIDAVKAQLAGGQKMSAIQLKHLEAEYPDLAKLLAQDFGASSTAAPDTTGAAPAPAAGDESASGAQPGAQSAPDPLQDPRVVEQLERAEKAAQAAHMVAVSTKHPDWRDLTKTPEFALWRSQLNPDAQHKLANTWDSEELIPAFDAYKDWKAKRDDANKQRDNRLANAMPATSGSATGASAPQDEEAAMLAGYKAARGGR